MSACTDAQFAKGSASPIACPDSSKLGDVQIDTPLLGTLDGSVFLGTPTPSAPLRLFVGVQQKGLSVKLIGLVHPAAADGQITTVFDDLPQVPFTAFRLMFRGGARAILSNPVDCGRYTATLIATPWSGQPDATRTATFDISGDGAGAACPTARPFAPRLSASVGSSQAGGDPGFLELTVERPDRDQRLGRLSLSLPPGALGRLASVPFCPEEDAPTGSCPDASRVGTVTATVGSGPAPAELSGPVYAAGPYRGGVASLVTVLPGRVGPLDVGTVVLRNALSLRSSDGGIDVVSDDLPAFVGGIPVAVRRLSVRLDRPGFLINPTSCGPLSVNGVFASAEGGSASASAPFQATGCEQLPFAPLISAVIGGRGQTGRLKHPFLRTVIEQRAGEAAIRTTTVTLPPVVGPDVNALQHACPPEVALSPSATCPDNTRIGTATAVSPLLPLPLSGPVYLLQVPGQPLPGIALDLRGLIGLRLPGKVTLDAQRRLVTQFDAIPDVPIERFELEFTGGRGGALQSVKDLCRSAGRVAAAFGAHSGASSSRVVPLLVDGCSTRASLALRGVRSGRPRLDLTLRGATGALGFARVELSLPRALAGVSRKARRGVQVYVGRHRVRGARASVRRSRIVLTGLPADQASLEVVVGNGALKPAGSLRRAVARRKRPRLSFLLRTAPAGKVGKPALSKPIRLSVRPRS